MTHRASEHDSPHLLLRQRLDIQHGGKKKKPQPCHSRIKMLKTWQLRFWIINFLCIEHVVGCLMQLPDTFIYIKFVTATQFFAYRIHTVSHKGYD